MRQGQGVSVDFIAAMVIFVVMIISGFYFLQNALVPTQGFSAQVQEAGENAWTNFQDETEWTVQSRPIIVRSDRALDNEPVEITTPFPGDTVEQSVLVMRNGRELVSQHNLSSNRTVFLTDIRAGTTSADVVWTEEGTLEDRNYSSDLEHGGDSVWNSKLNLTFTTNGLSQLSFDGSDLLQSSADLEAGSTPVFDVDLLRANVTYSAGGRKHVRLYDRSGQVRITEFFSGEREWAFNLTSGFDTMYSAEAGDVVHIDSAGTGIYTATTDWVDFNDSSQGLSIVADDMYVNVSRETGSSRVEVRVNFSDTGGRRDALLYAHGGGFTNATVQKDDFYDPYTSISGATESSDGVSRKNANDLEAEDTDTVRTRLELEGVKYNISIAGIFKKGEDVGTDTTVVVFQFPVAIMERFGNVTTKTMNFRVWN